MNVSFCSGPQYSIKFFISPSCDNLCSRPLSGNHVNQKPVNRSLDVGSYVFRDDNLATVFPDNMVISSDPEQCSMK